MMNATIPEPKTKRGRANLQGRLFWIWNIICLALILFGFAPTTIPQLVRSIQDGTTPVIYLVYSMVLVLIPVVSVLLGLFVLRKSPGRLFALGYVLEWPLLLILLFRFTLIREGNLSITLLLAWLAAAEAAFLWHLLDRKLDERGPGWIYLRLAGLSLLFAGTIYAAAWLAFYVPMLAYLLYQGFQSAIEGVVQFFRYPSLANLIRDLQFLPLAILSTLLGVFSASLIVVMPVAAPIIAGRAWLHSLRAAFQAGNSAVPGARRLAAWSVSLLPVAGIVVLVFISMRQPQAEAFALLEKPPATPQQAEALLLQQDKIREGLLNAYLAPFRYLSVSSEVRHISDMYRYSFSMSEEAAWQIEQAYEFVIQPLLYSPVHPRKASSRDNQTFASESAEAAALYQKFFDRPIVLGEQQAVVAAVRANSDGGQAELAWQAVDDREVFLNRQEVTISEHGDWADVEIHEVYQNRTGLRKETLYYFNLPESAVITGLWLGPDPERSKAFVHRVAPRGAAQAVYRNEIRLNKDPALVEQIGPRQYRLRAFPVEPRGWTSDMTSEHGPDLHLWMTYRVMAQENAWPLPQLAEKRNIFWDGSSTRLINGQPSPAAASDWFPVSVAAGQAVKPAAHRADYPNGQSVIARPVARGAATPGLPASGLRLAVVLDRSFSMLERTLEVKATLVNLKNLTQPGSQPDVYLTSSVYRGENPTRTTLAGINPDKVVYFGGQNAAELLVQFQQLQAGQKYDLILIVTDGNSFEVGKTDVKLNIPDAPVWIIHLGGFPLGYDDATTQALQSSGGGIAGSLEEALARFSAAQNNPGQLDILDGYEWQTLPTAQAHGTAALSGDDGFAALAARRVILSEMVKNKGALSQLATLDDLHQLAINSSIVTPYSSMLVLVEERQKELLSELEKQSDRFQREVEDIGDTSQTDPNIITGVPEPHEWVLIILAVLALGFHYRKNLANSSSRFSR